MVSRICDMGLKFHDSIVLFVIFAVVSRSRNSGFVLYPATMAALRLCDLIFIAMATFLLSRTLAHIVRPSATSVAPMVRYSEVT